MVLNSHSHSNSGEASVSINAAYGMIAHRVRYSPNSRPDAALRRMKRRAKTCLPRCKKGRGKLAPRRDATRSHAPQSAVACCPYSGSEE
jgi:hypothetical protein